MSEQVSLYDEENHKELLYKESLYKETIYKVSFYKAKQLQALRNLRIHSACIIQILSGSKRLFYKNDVTNLSSSAYLLCSASASLSFENLPQMGYFQSRVFSFYCIPDKAMLELSRKTELSSDVPIVPRDKNIDISLEALSCYDLNKMSEASQINLVMALYQQLAEIGVLHALFPEDELSFSSKVANYLAASPEQEHSLESVAEKFATSRATMIRRLAKENLRYRDLLAEVRLSYALKLMQEGVSEVSVLAHRCGYQSESRFSQRFVGKFGVTPKEYITSIIGN